MKHFNRLCKVSGKRIIILLLNFLWSMLCITSVFSWDGLQVLYKCNDSSATSGNISPHLQVFVNGTTNIRLSDVKIRYWLTNEPKLPLLLTCDYAQVGAANLTFEVVELALPVTGADTYCEIGFNTSAGILGPNGNSGDMQLRIHTEGYALQTQGNDYSFNSSITAYAANPKITAYFKGALIFGTDPQTGATAPTPPPLTSIDVAINTSQERSSISPYIYGSNAVITGTERFTAMRQGGNRLTGYNWENNYSNAGSDWNHSSDGFMVKDIPKEYQNIPGITTTWFHDNSMLAGSFYNIITIQMAGYVAADANGSVSEADTAPSSRWVPLYPKKGSAFSLTPNLNDNAVYMDEFVNFIVNKYGTSQSGTGVKAYSLDNEPGLWSETHPRIHPDKVGCAELVQRTIDYAKAVKAVDPAADILGFVSYGFNALNSLQGALDWNTYKETYKYYINYYLDELKKASDAHGIRLIDILDTHWYPEARGGGSRITGDNGGTNLACDWARVQAPRSFWDPNYLENSWISQWFGSCFPLITWLKASVDKYFPGTKLGCTEYNFGATDHITGGIAVADILGVFGKYDMNIATYWRLSGQQTYTSAAFKIFRNYDGAGSSYGNTKVKAETSDIENSSVYASIDGSDDSILHIIAINKNFDKNLPFNIDISGSRAYNSAEVWALDSTSAAITKKSSINNISGNSFTYTLPAKSVYHFVVLGSGVVITPTPTPVFTPLPTGVAGAFIESDGQVVMEAEHCTRNRPGINIYSTHSWEINTTESGASNNEYMESLPNTGINASCSIDAPVIEFDINVSTSGTYHLWVNRIAPDQASDSICTALNMGGITQFGYASATTWGWVKSSQTYTLGEGLQTLNIYMREDGSLIDKLILTTNSTYNPTGTGPAESPLEGGETTPTPELTPTPTPEITETPTPEPTATPSPTPVEDILGDVNGDNNINIIDALLIAQHYVGLEPSNFNASVADVNCSLSIDIIDALLVSQYYVGLIDKLPGCP